MIVLLLHLVFCLCSKMHNLICQKKKFASAYDPCDWAYMEADVSNEMGGLKKSKMVKMDI